MKKLNLVRKTLTSIAFGTSLMLAFVFAAQAQTPADTQQTQATTQETQVTTQQTQATTQETTQQTQQTQATTQQTTQQTLDTTPMFSDIPVGSTHYYAIKYLKEHNIIHGYDDGTFRSKKEINRAEALKIILGAISKDPQKKEVPTFDDVKETAWFYPFVLQGFQNEIVKGYPDGLFHPEQTITRAEALKIALMQENKALPTNVDVRPYSDVPTDVWYTPYAKVSKDRGLFVETRTNGGQLLPAATVNRGEFAEMMYHLIESNNGSIFNRASYYSDFFAGRGTSSGVPYDPDIFTAAHKTLPFGTILIVKNLANGQEVVVTVNDRGPFATGISLDLSKSAFASIAATSAGIINVEYKIKQ